MIRPRQISAKTKKNKALRQIITKKKQNDEQNSIFNVESYLEMILKDAFFYFMRFSFN